MADINDLLQKAEEAVDRYKELEAVEIPANVKEALKNKDWLPAVDAIQLTVLAAYDSDDRRADEKRVVSLRHLISEMQGFETDLVKRTVEKPEKIFFNQFYNTFAAAKFLAGQIADLFEALFTGDWTKFTLEKLIAENLEWIVPAAAAAEVAKQVDTVLHMRNKAVDRLRKKALPQRSGPRRFRRKTTRT